MATTKEKWQEIANRGLQDKFDPQTRARFDEAVNRGLITLPQQQAQTDPSDLPPGDLGPSFAQPKPERTLGEQIIGAGEAALTAATGATGGALGFGLGSIEGAVRDIAGDITQEEARQLAQQRATALTFEPRGEAGKEIVGDIAEVASVLPPVLGTGPVVGLNAASKLRFPSDA